MQTTAGQFRSLLQRNGQTQVKPENCLYGSQYSKSQGTPNEKKCYYDGRARHREFKVGEWVYMYNTDRKPGLSRKFFKPCYVPFQITAKVSDLIYYILGHKDRKLVVYVNRLKAAHGNDGRVSKPRTRRMRTGKNSSSVR